MLFPAEGAAGHICFQRECRLEPYVYFCTYVIGPAASQHSFALGWGMCEKCDEIDETIARYKRLKIQISDAQANQAADRLIAQLEAQKAALHPQ